MNTSSLSALGLEIPISPEHHIWQGFLGGRMTRCAQGGCGAGKDVCVPLGHLVAPQGGHFSGADSFGGGNHP